MKTVYGQVRRGQHPVCRVRAGRCKGPAGGDERPLGAGRGPRVLGAVAQQRAPRRGGVGARVRDGYPPATDPDEHAHGSAQHPRRGTAGAGAGDGRCHGEDNRGCRRYRGRRARRGRPAAGGQSGTTRCCGSVGTGGARVRVEIHRPDAGRDRPGDRDGGPGDRHPAGGRVAARPRPGHPAGGR